MNNENSGSRLSCYIWIYQWRIQGEITIPPIEKKKEDKSKKEEKEKRKKNG